MPKPNYAFEKRQRELAKRKKKEEKLEEKAQRKAAHSRGDGLPDEPAGDAGGSPADNPPPQGVKPDA